MLLNKRFVESFCRSKNSRYVTSKTGCYICWINLSDANAYESHMKQHLYNVKVGGFNASWKSLGNIELIGFNVTAEQSELTLKLRNNSNGVLQITQIAVYNAISAFHLIWPEAFPITLYVDGEITLKRDVNELSSANHILIVYETSTKDNCEAVQSYRIQKEETEQKQPAAAKELKVSTVSPRERGQPTKYSGSLELGKLSDYQPSDQIRSLFKAGFRRSEALTASEQSILKTVTEFKGPLTPSNYFDMVTLMVQMEDYGAQRSIMRSTKHNRSLVKLKGNEFVLKLNNREGRPLFLLAGDNIWIGKPDRVPRTYGFVQYVSSTEIKMKLQTSKSIGTEPIYSIHFELNRLTFKLQRLALETAKRLEIIDLLFPQRTRLHLLSQPTLPKLDIHNKRLKGDAHQMEAVHHIVAGTAYPFPYVLIGFPGTGKTATIVESIYQLWKTNANNRILVCAHSNSVCDEIAERLLAAIPRSYDGQQYNIIRLFAASVRKSCNNDNLVEHSNFDERRIPCLSELYNYRIVISTLTVSGRLLQAGMDSNHFTHLFIDECESATESFALLPIALCSSTRKINAQIVLSGDPNQLGPVVRETVAKQMTMDVSMLKRLSCNPVYEKDKKTNSYDRRITCRLRNNYRSHSDLVAMPNQLFYNNEMRCCIPNIEKINWLSELDFMPKKGFPVLFEHVDGIPETMDNCSSWFNETEQDSVLHYIDKLLKNEPQTIKQSDIGVIAAYKRQVIHIMEALEERNYSGIEVGTVEQFQGREKLIIIISTVRNGSLGFLKQRERINVLLTRAIGLLIIIGHTKTLHKNSDWKKVMEYTSDKCGGEIVADCGAPVGDYRC